jgi:hypothetical protein
MILVYVLFFRSVLALAQQTLHKVFLNRTTHVFILSIHFKVKAEQILLVRKHVRACDPINHRQPSSYLRLFRSQAFNVRFDLTCDAPYSPGTPQAQPDLDDNSTAQNGSLYYAQWDL